MKARLHGSIFPNIKIVIKARLHGIQQMTVVEYL
jgi:hypothetical protein